MKIDIRVSDSNRKTLASASGADEVTLVYDTAYREGDYLSVECGEPGNFIFLLLDDAVLPAFVYLKSAAYRFRIPFGEKRISYSPRAFTGSRHLLYARKARKEEILARKNLALNPLDTHENLNLFPHASANVETRGEAIFAARNAIDGLKANHSHGQWPYTSWGINRDPQAQLKIDFGRKVTVDETVLYLRSDFPHDAWWTSAVLHFSDGSRLNLKLSKTDKGQHFFFPPRIVDQVTLDTLIKAEDPSPFPALTQIEFYGTETNVNRLR